MRKNLQFITHYPISWLLVVVECTLSFMDVPETPLDNVSFIDKWTHLAMYCALTLAIWFEYFRHNKGKASNVWLVFWGWIVPSLMGGVIEILQPILTDGHRCCELLDFIADAIGATLAALLAMAIRQILKAKARN